MNRSLTNGMMEHISTAYPYFGGTRRTRQYLGNSKNNSRKWMTLEGVNICWIQGIMKDMKAKEK